MVVKTGIIGFDELYEENGLSESNAYLVKGAPGSGKTTFAIEYIYNGIKKFNENGLIISFEEIPNQLYKDYMKFGWDLKQLEEERKLKIIFTSP